MQIPENGLVPATTAEAISVPGDRPLPIAPVWHTVVLVLVILAVSFSGGARADVGHSAHGRLLTYAATASMELLLLGWVALGLWLRRVPFRSLFGVVERGAHGLAVDLGAAIVFWLGSMIVLGSIGLAWNAAEIATTHKNMTPQFGQRIEPSPEQKKTLETLEKIAPSGGVEIACWATLCLLVGPVEEAVFRGYLQRQFTAWSRGRIAAGVAASALLFGAAHGYEGLRSMVLLVVFGALFSFLALIRRGLRAGIIVHSAHDLLIGLLLVFVRAHHLV